MVKDIDVEDDDVGWGSSLWIKVRIDLSKPITQGETYRI